MPHHIVRRRRLLAAVFVTALAPGTVVPAIAQDALMKCSDPVPQDPAKVFRSGIWKQWIYWITPAPAAFAAVLRVVAEANAVRAAAGGPLVADPTSPLIVSVFDESNPRGANGSSVITTPLSNHEAFVATFVDDTAGGNEVFFLTDPICSNDVLTEAKLVPGLPGTFDRKVRLDTERDGVHATTSASWRIRTGAGDEIAFSATYGDAAIDSVSVSPASRIVFANCNLVSFSDVIYRSSPATMYTLFDRSQGNFIALPKHGVEVQLHMRHHDPDINQMFNDAGNVPSMLIETDRVVRFERK